MALPLICGIRPVNPPRIGGPSVQRGLRLSRIRDGAVNSLKGIHPLVTSAHSERSMLLSLKLHRSVATAATAFWMIAATTAAQAVAVQHELTQGPVKHWTVKFDVSNDGSVSEVSNFTVYFDWHHASNLQLLAAPASWDTIVIAPDVVLTSDGFMDALALTPADVLMPGDTVRRFEVGFDWDATSGQPQAFDFAVYDAKFNVVWSGVSTPAGTQAVPTPPSWSLAGLGLVGWVAVRRCRKN